MDGIRNIAGRRTARLTVNGKAYTVEPQVLAEYAERESYILALKPHPLDVIEHLPPLPAAPQVPDPPDPQAGAEGAKAYAPKLAAFQRAKAVYDHHVATRARLESRAWSEAMRPRIVTVEDEQHFDSSLHGIAWRLWRAVRKHHPEINSVQAALDLIESAGTPALPNIVEALEQAEEKDILGNSASPTDQVGDQPADASRGQSSTGA